MKTFKEFVESHSTKDIKVTDRAGHKKKSGVLQLRSDEVPVKGAHRGADENELPGKTSKR